MTRQAAFRSGSLQLSTWEDYHHRLLPNGDGSRVVGSVITDTPYSVRTHDGHAAGTQPDRRGMTRKQIPYSPWAVGDVHTFVKAWAPCVEHWIAALCSHDLAGAWEAAFENADFKSFAPVPVIFHDSVRRSGDGPANACSWLMVGRRKSKAMTRWGSLRGWYEAKSRARVGYPGAKPIPLMREIVSDYADSDHLVVDTMAGSGATLAACESLGVPYLGIERDPAAFELACEQLATCQLHWPLKPRLRKRSPATSVQLWIPGEEGTA